MNKIDLPETCVANNCSIIGYDDARWLSFISTHPEATIFHHPAWMDVMNSCYGYEPFIIAVCDNNGEIKAGIPIMNVNLALRPSRWISLPFTDYCNPLYFDDISLGYLTDCIAMCYQERMVRQIELRYAFPCDINTHTLSNFFLHTIPLDSDVDKVTKRFNRVHRQNIRAAEQKGVTIERGNQLEHLLQFYNIQLETRRRHGVPAQPKRFFYLLADKICSQDLGFVLLAYKDNKCLGGLVLLCWGGSLMAKYAASYEDSLNLRPNNLLFNAAIDWGCRNGFRIFDMGRSTTEQSGLCRYKRGWGAEEKPLSYTIFSTASASPRTHRMSEDIANTIFKHSPTLVCRLVGELFYKYMA